MSCENVALFFTYLLGNHGGLPLPLTIALMDGVDASGQTTRGCSYLAQYPTFRQNHREAPLTITTLFTANDGNLNGGIFRQSSGLYSLTGGEYFAEIITINVVECCKFFEVFYKYR